MTSCRITIGETRVRITAEEDFFAVAEGEIRRVRGEIETYLSLRPEFRTSLSPLRDDPAAPPAVRRMLRAARRAGVGPMAAVAGAVAGSCLRAMVRAGAEHAVVENGGDIAMILDRPVTVGVFAGDTGSDAIGLRFKSRRDIVGVCTSSGTVGHSLSFGLADAAVAVAPDPVLADAAATALCNAVRRRSDAGLLKALEKSWIPGIEGMLLVAGPHAAARGRLPEIVRTHIGKAALDFDNISDSRHKVDSGRNRSLARNPDYVPQRFSDLPQSMAASQDPSPPHPSCSPEPANSFSLSYAGYQSRAANSELHSLASPDVRLPAAIRGVYQPDIKEKTGCCSGNGENTEVFRQRIRTQQAETAFCRQHKG